MQAIKFDVDGDGIATILIDLEDRSMNVITPAFSSELAGAVERVASTDDIKGAVVTSGKDSFMAGADPTWLVTLFASGQSADELYAGCRALQQTLRRMETCGKPFAAAINGTALGGGFEICLACHHRVASDIPSYVVGLPEVQLGLLPGAGGTQRLPRLIGLEAALPLLLEGKHLRPSAALESGLVHELVPPDQLIGAAKRWLMRSGTTQQPWDIEGFKVPGGAGLMHPKSTRVLMVGTGLVAQKTSHNYPAPISILSSAYEGTVVPIDTGLDIETKYLVSLLMSPVARNMTRTLFLSKDAADKLVRRPKGIAKHRATKLGVLGAGMMGSGIAYLSARAGIEVVLLDTTSERARKGKNVSRALLEGRVARGRQDEAAATELLGRIHPTDDFDDLAGCDLVIEAVFESREVKVDATRKAAAVIPEAAVFASNTSTLPITSLAAASDRPELFLGLHFFSPVDRMPLVEVIMGEQTGEVALARGLDYVQQIGKTPIVVNDSCGFYTSRVFGTYIREGMTLLSEGVGAALIENVARQAGMPVGPLAVADEVSLELAYQLNRQTRADLGDEYPATPADEVVRQFVEDLDRRGKRFGKGFYDYPEGGKKRLWSGLSRIFPPVHVQPAADEIRRRLLYIQALETVRCLDEGVVGQPADADVGSILGWGFPAYTGGTVSFIETVGLKTFADGCERMAEAYGDRFAVPASLRERADERAPFYPEPAGTAARLAGK